MRVLGLDLGSRRIGLAISDPDARIALPGEALERRGLERDLAALCALVVDRGVERIVVGLPLHMNGSRGPEARAAEEFARALERASGRPVETLDERWTSVQAERVLRETGRRQRQKARKGQRRETRHGRGEVDAVAASIILQTYLEQRRGAGPAGALAEDPAREGS